MQVKISAVHPSHLDTEEKIGEKTRRSSVQRQASTEKVFKIAVREKMKSERKQEQFDCDPGGRHMFSLIHLFLK